MSRRLLVAVVVAVGFVLMAATPAGAAQLASCYGDPTDGFLGGTTASGTIVRGDTVGLAHKTLPLGTVLMVKVAGRRPIRARVIDRGPYVPGRFIDVTWGLAKRLGYPTCAWWGVRPIRTWRA